MRSSNRANVIESLAKELSEIQCSHPLRVAIDGVDCSGKTTLADELSSIISDFGRPVIRASIDGFHQPREFRYQKGTLSPEGYYFDSFNYEALIDGLLSPLGPGGSLRYKKSIFDFRKDVITPSTFSTAPENAILLFDGVFCLRPELNHFWDYRIFVDANFEITLSRAKVRDLKLFGTVEEIETRYEKRYIPGQRIYLETINPKDRAQIVIENNIPDSPSILRNKDLKIRTARIEDVEMLSALALRSKAYWDYSSEYLSKCRQELTLSQEYINRWPVIVAEGRLHPVGFGSLTETNGTYFLDHLWVEPFCVGKGIGKILFTKLVDEARRLRWPYFQIVSDPKASNFYEHVGAKIIGEVPSKYMDGLNLPLLKVDLKK